MKYDLDLKALMQQAAQFTRGGDLHAATAAIQAALQGRAPAAAPADATVGDDIIDVEARIVPGDPNPADSPAPAAPGPQVDHAAQGPARFDGSHFSLGGLQCDYKLFVPAGAGTAGPVPLVVMLHGCTQNPDDFATGTGMNDVAAAHGACVLYPAQSQRGNAQRCWNWFKHNHQTRGRGEPALLAALTRDVMARLPIDPHRVYVAGLSAGGAMAAILGEAYPELYAAVGVHSGLAAGAATDLPGALAAMQGGANTPRTAASGMPTISFHGDADKTVHPRNGQQVVAASVGKRAPSATRTDRRPGGRTWTRDDFLGAQGAVVAERWTLHGTGHAWSGGSSRGSYTDPQGPDASAEMMRFFLAHPRP